MTFLIDLSIMTANFAHFYTQNIPAKVQIISLNKAAKKDKTSVIRAFFLFS